MLLQAKYVISSFILVTLISGCAKKNDDSVQRGRSPISPWVTKDNYLTGPRFCEVYAEKTKKEKGFRVNVPVDYSNPSGEKISIYAWFSKGRFDASLPTYVIIDGGPGQNTHGIKEIVPQWNELHFDQRGLGCSAPDTFEKYKSNTMYSTANTIRDMEEIRKYLNVNEWTVYGISYGTMPATMYAHNYPKSTRAVVLEGTVFSGDYIHDVDYKVKKLQTIYDSLSSGTKSGIDKILSSEDLGMDLYIILSTIFYSENYVEKIKIFLTNHIRSATDYDSQFLHEIAGKIQEDDEDYPQHPGAVDRHIFTVISCRELDGQSHNTHYWNFSNGRFFSSSDEKNGVEFCKKVGLENIKTKKYQAFDYPVSKPVTYLQGAQDGATNTTGAMKHWKTVPQNFTQMLLNKLGGHNPNISDLEVKLDDKDTSTQEATRRRLLKSAALNMFTTALAGQAISNKILTDVNSNSEFGQEWILLKNPEEGDGQYRDYLSRPMNAANF